MAQGKDLLLKIKADTSDAQKGISDTDSKLNSLSKTAKKAGALKIKADTSDAQKDISNTDSKLDSLSTTAKKVGAAMLAAFAASKIIDGIKSVSDAAQESDKAMALVESTIKATGGAANLTAKEVSNLADEITKNTGISDEAIMTGENMLLTFKNLKGEAFEKATKALVDMNTVMTNGNVTSESLSSQAIQLGKALNNPTEGMAALSRVGVQFTEKQKEQIKILQESGDIMGAQNIILNELESEFGGAAKAIGDTFGGQVMKTSESISTMKERLGKIVNILAMEFLPIIIKGADKIANFFNEDRVERWSNAIILAFKAVDLVLKPITLTIGKSLEGWGKIISLVTDYGNEVAKVDKKSAESITKQISLLKDKIEETLLSDALDATKKAGIQKYNDEIDLLYKDLKAIKANQKEKDKNHKTNIKYNADENISEEDKLKKQKEVSDKILKNFELNLAKKKADIKVSTQEEITQYEKLLENAQLTADARREIELKIAELGQKRRDDVDKDKDKIQELIDKLKERRDREIEDIDAIKLKADELKAKYPEMTVEIDNYKKGLDKSTVEIKANYDGLIGKAKDLKAGNEGVTDEIKNIEKEAKSIEPGVKASMKGMTDGVDGLAKASENSAKKMQSIFEQGFATGEWGKAIKGALSKELEVWGAAEASKAAMAGLAAAIPTFGGSLIVAAGQIIAIMAQVEAGKAAINAVPFQSGGIVPGNSLSGDRINAKVNSGEMVLNTNQQTQLFKMLNGGGGTSSGQGTVININGGIFMADRTQAKQLALMIDEELVKLKRQNLRVS